jgi:hypothetical protein
MAMPEPVRLRPPAAKGGFSLDPGLIREIFRYARPLGHHHAADTLNLGFIYQVSVKYLRDVQAVCAFLYEFPMERDAIRHARRTAVV